MKIKVNGFVMNYELEGPAEAPVVTLSHSLAANLSMWDQQVYDLRKTYRVLRFDTRGHGQSEAFGDAYTMETLVEDARGLLDALEIERTHFVGLSLGGMIGQLFALRSPERLESLVLCDTTSRVPESEAKDRAWDERIEKVKLNGLAGIADQTISRWLTPSFIAEQPEMIARIKMMILDTSSKGYIGCIHAIKDFQVTQWLAKIRVPTLVVVGDQDLVTPVAAAQILHSGIEGSKLLVLESASHLSNVEQPEIFNDALSAFLAAQGREGSC